MVYDYRFMNIYKRELFILITANAVEFDIDESLWQQSHIYIARILRFRWSCDFITAMWWVCGFDAGWNTHENNSQKSSQWNSK